MALSRANIFGKNPPDYYSAMIDGKLCLDNSQSYEIFTRANFYGKQYGENYYVDPMEEVPQPRIFIWS